jgi:catechol 2,3-dioxygenase-like lactoylglutathione lyase family enzyme
MLEGSKLVGFVGTCDAARARDFYETTLGLRLVEDNGFSLVFDAHGNPLRVQRVEAVAPHVYTALGWDVAEIVDTVRALAGRGVAFLRVPGLTQDDDAIWHTPDGSMVAWFHDPDGNTLSLAQHRAR